MFMGVMYFALTLLYKKKVARTFLQPF